MDETVHFYNGVFGLGLDKPGGPILTLTVRDPNGLLIRVSAAR